MPIAQPHTRLAGRFSNDLLIKPNRLVEIAQLTQGGSAQVRNADVFRIDVEDVVEQFERFGRAPGSTQDEREICLRRCERGSDLQRSAKQVLRIPPAPDARRQLGEHADRQRVERIFLQVGLQQPLGDVEPVFIHRQRGLDETRMPLAADGGLGRHGSTVASSETHGYAHHP